MKSLLTLQCEYTSLELPCTLCKERGFQCGVAEKIHGPEKERKLVDGESDESEIPGLSVFAVVSKHSPPPVSRPLLPPDDFQLAPEDRRYLRFLDEENRAWVFHPWHWNVFISAPGHVAQLLRRCPEILFASKPFRYAILACSSKEKAALIGGLQDNTYAYQYLCQFYSEIQEGIATEAIPQVIYGCLAMIIYELSDLQKAALFQEPSRATDTAKRAVTHLIGLSTALRSFQVVLWFAPTSINMAALHYLWCIVLSHLKDVRLISDSGVLLCECHQEICNVSRIVTGILSQRDMLTFDGHTPNYGVNILFRHFIYGILAHYIDVQTDSVQKGGKNSRTQEKIGSALRGCIDFVIELEGLEFGGTDEFTDKAALAVLLKHLLFSDTDIIHTTETTRAALALYSCFCQRELSGGLFYGDLAYLFWAGVVLNSATNLEGNPL
jgi:hypothetical protein